MSLEPVSIDLVARDRASDGRALRATAGFLDAQVVADDVGQGSAPEVAAIGLRLMSLSMRDVEAAPESG